MDNNPSPEVTPPAANSKLLLGAVIAIALVIGLYFVNRSPTSMAIR